MAVVNVTFGVADQLSLNGTSMPVFRAIGVSEDETIGVASVATTATSAEKGGRGIVRVQAEDVCYVEIGSSPTAVSGTSMRMAAGQTEYFACDRGDTVAIIQA